MTNSPTKHDIEFVGFTEEEIHNLRFTETFTKPMKKETAYISGKISNLPDLNKPKFEKAEAKVIQIGFNPCNPHKLPDNHNKKWNSYMKVCLSHLHMCDLVVALDDWKKSRGAIIEIWNAEWVDIPVFELETMRPIKLTFWIKVKLLLNLI